MKASKMILTAVAAAIAMGSAIAMADQPVVYGRAGIPVAEERIKQLAQVKASDSAPAANAVTWYGRAGGPIGIERVTGPNAPVKAYAAGQSKTPVVYGRAGVPLPFGG